MEYDEAANAFHLPCLPPIKTLLKSLRNWLAICPQQTDLLEMVVFDLFIAFQMDTVAIFTA